MAGAAVVVADAGHPAGQRGRRVGPLARLRHGRGGAREIGRDGERMRRQRGVAFALTPRGEPAPVGGVVAARRLGPGPRDGPGHLREGLGRQHRHGRRSRVRRGRDRRGNVVRAAADQVVGHGTGAYRSAPTLLSSLEIVVGEQGVDLRRNNYLERRWRRAPTIVVAHHRIRRAGRRRCCSPRDHPRVHLSASPAVVTESVGVEVRGGSGLRRVSLRFRRALPGRGNAARCIV